MILSIKFTSHNIFISEQKANRKTIKVSKNIVIDMPEGAYQRGVIIDTTMVADKIKEALRENNVRTKNATVMIQGMDIIEKDLKIPRASLTQVRGMVENELRKFDLLKSDYVFDFAIDGSKNDEEVEEEMQNITAFLVPKTLLQNYVQTLQRAGLNPCGLKPFHDAMNKLVRLLKVNEEDDMTILAYVENNTAELCMTGKEIKNIYRSIQSEQEELIEENIYILSTRQNVTKEKKPQQAMLSSLTENISKLVQFQLQRNRERKVKQILVYGEAVQSEGFLESLAESTGIPVRECTLKESKIKIASKQNSEGFHYDLAAVNASGLLGERKEVNLFHPYKEQKSGYITKKDRIPLYIAAVLLLLLLIAGSIAFLLDYGNKQRIKAYEDQIEQIITSQEYNENLIKIGMVEEYTIYNRICNQYIEILDTTGRLEADLIRKIERLKNIGVTIDGYSFENAVFVLDCKTFDQEEPAFFAQTLTEAELFKTVEYTGFQAETDVEGNIYYRFSLKCSLELE